MSKVAVGFLQSVTLSQKVAVEIMFQHPIFRIGAKQEEKQEGNFSNEEVYMFYEKGQLRRLFPLPVAANFGSGRNLYNAKNSILWQETRNGVLFIMNYSLNLSFLKIHKLPNSISRN